MSVNGRAPAESEAPAVTPTETPESEHDALGDVILSGSAACGFGIAAAACHQWWAGGRMPGWPAWVLSLAFLVCACATAADLWKLARYYWRVWRER